MANDTSDVVERETAWLLTSGDGLPALLTTHGGNWDLVQAYFTLTPRIMKKSIYVTRGVILYDHVAAQRYRPQHEIILKLRWPVKQQTSPLAEQEQAALDVAIQALILRIAGPVGDKTHGARFLSAGEAPGQASVTVMQEDPETTIPTFGGLRATAVYHIDDNEVTG